MSPEHSVLLFGLLLDLRVNFEDPEFSLCTFQSFIDSIAHLDIVQDLNKTVEFELSKLVNLIRLMLCIIVQVNQELDYVSEDLLIQVFASEHGRYARQLVESICAYNIGFLFLVLLPGVLLLVILHCHRQFDLLSASFLFELHQLPERLLNLRTFEHVLHYLIVSLDLLDFHA